ncbi:unnamed protein product [Zymoseptoria tritici ST99CH_1E4]|uniref:Heterokaryon incompatibility domain-containing protein n=1 Tax=Zymoseptoria tritici ST99CH_1E4 TaxID=1276532 RepID=A0A2H1GUP5_ZYMTR|nr:unnamed protein product [Zymoseptoria tritici ST99CH_1E4]
MDADAIVTVQPDSEDTPPLDIGLFKHEPLRDSETQIRLIRLKPGRQDDNIELELSRWEFENAPEYHAISYTWGADVRRIIFINGLAHWVRHNCHYALMQARLHYPETYIWLDSICIDQDVDREKSHQVAMMKDIYVKADWVLACIGPHENGSEIILEVVDRVMRLDNSPTLAMLVGWHPSREQWDYWLSWLIDEWSDGALAILRQALTRFTLRDYWTRLWIVQEIAAAAGRVRIFCGSNNLSRTAFQLITQLASDHRPWAHLWRHSSLSNPMPPSAHRLVSLSKAQVASVSFEEAMGITFAFRCSDPRDKVFAILSLVAWPQRCKAMVPDYAMSNVQVALEAIRHLKSFHSLPWIPRHLCLSCSDSQLLALRQASQRLEDERVHLNGYAMSARIRVGPSGMLTAHIGYRENADSAEAQPIALRLLEAPDGMAFETLEVAAGLAGYLCSDTKAGDVIVELVVHDAACECECVTCGCSHLLLVVRKNSTSTFDVVGQGFLLPGYEISYEATPESESGQAEKATMINVEITLTAADALLLAAQDLNSISYGFDARARAERLIVNPFSSPLSAVSLTPLPPSSPSPRSPPFGEY